MSSSTGAKSRKVTKEEAVWSQTKDGWRKRGSFTAVAGSAPDTVPTAVESASNTVPTAVESAPNAVPTAVAESELVDSSQASGSQPDDNVDESSDSEDEEQQSITAVAGKRRRILPPAKVIQGVQRLRVHGTYNNEPEVGNVGLYFGNWGTRATLITARKKDAQEINDRQIEKCPASIICLAEATVAVQHILESDHFLGDAEATGLEGRPKYKHFVIRGDEESSVLIGARTDVCSALELLDFEVHHDHKFRANQKDKMARTRIIVAKVTFKQNIGHIGHEVVVANVHYHYMTAKQTFPAVAEQFWDRLAARINKYGIKFLTGDFNMSLTEVPFQLRKRGIHIDCVAWYPWCLSNSKNDIKLGFDSCGIFYIGGMAGIRLQYHQFNIPNLISAVAEEFGEMKLDEYVKERHPGQPWTAYVSAAKGKTLREKLEGLLQPENDEIDLRESLETRNGVTYCPFLRIKQKPLDQKVWLINGEMHKGAHFPLCVFTNNSSHRSKDSQDRRFQKNIARQNELSAVAAQTGITWKGKGQMSTVSKGKKGKGGSNYAAHNPASAVPQSCPINPSASSSSHLPAWVPPPLPPQPFSSAALFTDAAHYYDYQRRSRYQ
jgi:endonuclease/exonuclease/phosphatase family metal-dependent hydrolase